MTVLCSDRGERLPLHPVRWHDAPTSAERALLENMTPPVLDVGCGPGRMVAALGGRGIPALGGPWFAWAVVGADAIEEVASCAGLAVTAMVRAHGELRWWATLQDATRGVDAVA